jgi:hypothetical protein
VVNEPLTWLSRAFAAAVCIIVPLLLWRRGTTRGSEKA